MIKEEIREVVNQCISILVTENKLDQAAIALSQACSITRPKDESHGDYSINIAMILARPLKKSPREVAGLVSGELSKNHDYFSKVDIAGPGFINLFLSDKFLSRVIPQVAKEGAYFGKSPKNGKKALVEFVSANPTGGLHLGHARGAFVGDAIARLLAAAGFTVTKEFYVNDAGNQVETLGRTIYKRYLELFGRQVEILPGEYPGEYVKDIAAALKKDCGDKWLDKPEGDWLEAITRFGIDYNLTKIKSSLSAIDIEMDSWLLESSLHQSGVLEQLIDEYQARSMVYEAQESQTKVEKVRREESKAAKFAHMQEGGIFLKTSQFGDDEDRIIKRKDGRFVYLTADLAYHHQKFLRDYHVMVDVFGADHAGHIGRIKAGMEALGHDINKLHFAIVQMVRLLKNGQELKFSKRAGEVLGLDDLIEEVGKDVARFVFLMRSTNTHFDLDLDLVTKQSHENPVFYVQYGHARMATILKKAADDFGLSVDALKFDEDLQQHLTISEERAMLLKLSELQEVVFEAANAAEPHRLIHFCQDLIKSFHSYFTKYRHSEKIISDDKDKTTARLCLVFAMKQAIFNALTFLGLSAPDHMDAGGLTESEH